MNLSTLGKEVAEHLANKAEKIIAEVQFTRGNHKFSALVEERVAKSNAELKAAIEAGDKAKVAKIIAAEVRKAKNSQKSLFRQAIEAFKQGPQDTYHSVGQEGIYIYKANADKKLSGWNAGWQKFRFWWNANISHRYKTPEIMATEEFKKLQKTEKSIDSQVKQEDIHPKPINKLQVDDFKQAYAEAAKTIEGEITFLNQQGLTVKKITTTDFENEKLTILDIQIPKISDNLNIEGLKAIGYEPASDVKNLLEVRNSDKLNIKEQITYSLSDHLLVSGKDILTVDPSHSEDIIEALIKRSNEAGFNGRIVIDNPSSAQFSLITQVKELTQLFDKGFRAFGKDASMGIAENINVVFAKGKLGIKEFPGPVIVDLMHPSNAKNITLELSAENADSILKKEPLKNNSYSDHVKIVHQNSFKQGAEAEKEFFNHFGVEKQEIDQPSQAKFRILSRTKQHPSQKEMLEALGYDDLHLTSQSIQILKENNLIATVRVGSQANTSNLHVFFDPPTPTRENVNIEELMNQLKVMAKAQGKDSITIPVKEGSNTIPFLDKLYNAGFKMQQDGIYNEFANAFDLAVQTQQTTWEKVMNDRQFINKLFEGERPSLPMLELKITD